MAIYIDGVKHACVPCIRGHRSTKCQHRDRVLVNVRKPGRPLSSCPHPGGGVGCQCGRNVRAALPRNTKCGCPAEDGEDEHLVLEASQTPNGVKNEPESAELGPMSPGRIHKTKAAQKVLYDPSQLERMDMSNINLVHNVNGVPSSTRTQSNIASHAGVTSYPDPPAPGQFQSLLHGFTMGNDMYQGQYSQLDAPQQLGGMVASAPGISRMENGNGHLAGPPPNTNGNGTYTEPQHDQVPRIAGSCCSSKAQAPSQAQPVRAAPNSVPAGPTNSGVPVATHEYSSNSFIPTAYNELGLQPVLPFHQVQDFSTSGPKNLGTINRPLQRTEWERIMMAQDQSAPSQDHMPPSQIHQHVCGCGEGCQCVGCQAHPFNATTKALIESAYEDISDREDANSRTTSSTPQEMGEAQSPNQDAGTTMMSSDFLFVNYDIDIGCGGEQASCRCGPSCACLGCVIHGKAET